MLDTALYRRVKNKLETKLFDSKDLKVDGFPDGWVDGPEKCKQGKPESKKS